MQMSLSEKLLFLHSSANTKFKFCMRVQRSMNIKGLKSNLEPEYAMTNWMSAAINYWRSVWRERKTTENNLQEGWARNDGRLWTDSALPWLWEPQLSSLLSILVAAIAQSLLLTRYAMAFCPPFLYFLHFKVVDKGRKGGECFHTQLRDSQAGGKAFFNAGRKSLSKQDALQRPRV